MAARTEVAHSTVWTIWIAHHLQPHRVDTLKLRPRLRFADKLADVVRLYLHPLERALIFSVDE